MPLAPLHRDSSLLVPLWVAILLLSFAAHWINRYRNRREDLRTIKARVDGINGTLIHIHERAPLLTGTPRHRHLFESRYTVTFADAAGQQWQIKLFTRCDWLGRSTNWYLSEVLRLTPTGAEPINIDLAHPFTSAAIPSTHRGERPAHVQVIFKPARHRKPLLNENLPKGLAGPRRRRPTRLE